MLVDGPFVYAMGTAFPAVHYGLRPNAPYELVDIFLFKVQGSGW
ncbi:hypothetical protein [Marinomonas epiphytica]